MADKPDPERLDRWTWRKEDVEFERDPDLPPLLTPEDREEIRRQLAEMREEPATDAEPPTRDRRIVRWKRRKY